MRNAGTLPARGVRERVTSPHSIFSSRVVRVEATLIAGKDACVSYFNPKGSAEYLPQARTHPDAIEKREDRIGLFR